MRSLFTLAALVAATPALAFDPDLIVTDVEVESNNAPTAEVRVTFANVGVDPIQQTWFCVDLFVGHAVAPQIGDFGDEFECRSFDVDIAEKVHVYFKVAPVAAGTWLDAIVDTDQLVPEGDETNNIRSVRFD